MGTVSIVIPTYHATSLEATVDGLMAQSSWPSIAEIVVVGRQPPGPWRTRPKVRYIEVMDRPSPAHNRNVGAQLSSAPWLCFLDSDCLPMPDWLERLMEHAERYGARALCGSVTVPEDTSYWALCDHLLAFRELTRTRGVPQWVPYGASLNLCMRRDLFHALGGFDTAFAQAAGEDWDLCERLSERGEGLLFVPTATVIHCHSRRDLRSAWEHLYRYGTAVATRRALRGPDWRLQWGYRLARVPFLLELYGLARVLVRAPLHFAWRDTASPRKDWRIPWGMIVLDLALSHGIVHGVRRRALADHGVPQPP